MDSCYQVGEHHFNLDYVKHINSFLWDYLQGFGAPPSMGEQEQQELDWHHLSKSKMTFRMSSNINIHIIKHSHIVFDYTYIYI